MSLGRYRASVDCKNCIFLNCNFPNCIFQNSIFFQTVFFAVYLANESSKLCEFILTERGVPPPTTCVVFARKLIVTDNAVPCCLFVSQEAGEASGSERQRKSATIKLWHSSSSFAVFYSSYPVYSSSSSSTVYLSKDSSAILSLTHPHPPNWILLSTDVKIVKATQCM